MRKGISHLGIAAFAVIALAVTAGPALGGDQPGHTVKIASEITMPPNSPAFHGRVKAKNENCVEQRKVKLFKKRSDGSKKKLGTDVTDNKGKWKVLVDPLKKGDYFAVVKRVEEGTAGTIYVCEKDRSPTAHIVISPRSLAA